MLEKTASRIVAPAAILIGFLFGSQARAQAPAHDVVTVGTVSGSGTVDVPVFIRDVSGTPLGIDQPAGSRLQAYSLKVNYAPAVSSITFSRAGITASLTPTFESSPSSPGSISLIDTFQESTNLIPFTVNAAAPGNQVGHLVVNVPPALPPGTVITLTLDSGLTQLTNEGGTTSETVGNGTLALINGSITVLASPTPVPTLGTWALILLAVSVAVVALKMLSKRDSNPVEKPAGI